MRVANGWTVMGVSDKSLFPSLNQGDQLVWREATPLVHWTPLVKLLSMRSGANLDGVSIRG